MPHVVFAPGLQFECCALIWRLWFSHCQIVRAFYSCSLSRTGRGTSIHMSCQKNRLNCSLLTQLRLSLFSSSCSILSIVTHSRTAPPLLSTRRCCCCCWPRPLPPVHCRRRQRALHAMAKKISLYYKIFVVQFFLYIFLANTSGIYNNRCPFFIAVTLERGWGEANGACPSCAYVQLQLLAVSTRQAALTYPQQQRQQPPLAFGLRQQKDMYTYVCV